MINALAHVCARLLFLRVLDWVCAGMSWIGYFLAVEYCGVASPSTMTSSFVCVSVLQAYELGIVFPHQLQHSLGLLSTHHWAARHAGGMINGLPICEQRFTQSQQKFQRQLMAQQQQQHQQQILAMQQAGIIPAPGSAQGVVPPHFNQQQAQLALATMVILAKTSKLQQSSSQAASDSEDANEKSDGGLSSGTEKLSLSERESTPITIPGRQPALNGESPLLSNSASRSPLSSSPALASSSPSARPTPAVAVQVSPLQRQDNGSSTSQQVRVTLMFSLRCVSCVYKHVSWLYQALSSLHVDLSLLIGSVRIELFLLCPLELVLITQVCTNLLLDQLKHTHAQ